MLELRALPEARPGQVRLLLRWTGGVEGLVLRRRRSRPPETAEQGERLLVLGGPRGQAALEPASKGTLELRREVTRDPLTRAQEHALTLTDRGAPPGQPVGYAVFRGDERLAALSVVPAADRGSGARLYGAVPAALRRLDEDQQGQLRAFLAVLGGGLDLARSGDARLEGLHDLRRAPDARLHALRAWLGWPGEETGEALREALRRAPAHYDQAGTLEGLRALIRQRSPAPLRVRPEAEHLLRTWDPDQVRGWDLFTSRLEPEGWRAPERVTAEGFFGGPSWGDGGLLAHRWTDEGFRLVTDEAWSPPAPGPGVDVLDPLALRDGEGRGWRLWRETRAGASTLWRQVDGQEPAPLTGLGLPEDLLVGAPGTGGGLLLAWRVTREGRPWRVLAQQAADGALDWQAEELPGLHGLATAGQGASCVLATLRWEGEGSRLELRSWRAGAWQHLSALALPTEALEPSLAWQGRALHAVWSALTPAGWRLRHARFMGGAWSEPAPLFAGPAADRAPALGLDEGGGLRLAWRSQRARLAGPWTTVDTEDTEALRRWGQPDDPLATTVHPGGRRDLPVVSVHLGPGEGGALSEEALAAVAAGVDPLTALHLRLRWVAEPARLELPELTLRAAPAATLTWTDSTPSR